MTGVVTHTYNPSTQMAEQENIREFEASLSYIVRLKTNLNCIVRPWIQKREKKRERKKKEKIAGIHFQMCLSCCFRSNMSFKSLTCLEVGFWEVNRFMGTLFSSTNLPNNGFILNVILSGKTLLQVASP